MESNRYKHLWVTGSEEEGKRLESQLMRKLDWISKHKKINRHSSLIFDQSPTEQFNNSWKSPTFWTHPKFISKLILKEKTGFNYPGEYEIPIQLILNEDFSEFLKRKDYQTIIKNLKKEGINSSKQNLMSSRSELRSKIYFLHEEFQPLMQKLSEYFIWHIQKSSNDVEKYSPREPSSKNGKDTDLRDDLIRRAEIAYYGIYCGSIFAYEWIASDYVTKKTAYILDELFELQNEILEVSKEFVAVQIMVEHGLYSRGGMNEKVIDFDLSEKVEHCIIEEQMRLPETGLYKFITAKNKIKHSTIGDYLNEKFELDYSYKGIAEKVKDILPGINIVEKKGNQFYKKRK